MNYEKLSRTQLIALIRQLREEKAHQPSIIFDELCSMRLNYDQENFILIVLDRKLHILKKMVLFKGGTESSIVDIRLLMGTALSVRTGTGMIVAHNHPSRCLTPSREDIECSQRIRDSCRLLGIQLVDVLIFSEFSYLSLTAEGHL